MANCFFTIKSVYFEEDYEYSVRDGSLEFNHYSGRYNVLRRYTGNGVYVASSPSRGFDELTGVFKGLNMYGSYRVYCDEFYNGEYRSGKPVDNERALEIINRLREGLRGKGINSEIILVSRHIRVEHSIEEYSVHAVDDRWIHELYIYTYKLYMGNLSSTSRLIASSDLGVFEDMVELLVDDHYKRNIIQLSARRFNPIHSGGWKTILMGDAASSFYHELAHLLEGDEPVKLPIGAYIGGEISMVEDPFYNTPLQRVFDDELYPAWRRVLIDNGVVVDYFRTRLSAGDSKPGNARGLFTRPKPFYHQLIVKPGDWSLDEALEELRRVLIIENILESRLFGDYIEIIPENAYVYDKKTDRIQPVKNLVASIPLKQLDKSIIGLMKTLHHRYSYEKKHPIYEVTPPIILEAKIKTP